MSRIYDARRTTVPPLVKFSLARARPPLPSLAHAPEEEGQAGDRGSHPGRARGQAEEGAREGRERNAVPVGGSCDRGGGRRARPRARSRLVRRGRRPREAAAVRLEPAPVPGRAPAIDRRAALQGRHRRRRHGEAREARHPLRARRGREKPRLPRVRTGSRATTKSRSRRVDASETRNRPSFLFFQSRFFFLPPSRLRLGPRASPVAHLMSPSAAQISFLPGHSARLLGRHRPEPRAFVVRRAVAPRVCTSMIESPLTTQPDRPPLSAGSDGAAFT